MPTFYDYALNDMEESQINEVKRRVTGYNNNQTERLSSKPEEDPTNGLIDIQLSRLTDEIYLAGKEIDNLDSYLQIDTSLIVMNAGIPSAIKKTIQDSVKIYISINQSVEKIRRTYRNLSKNIKFASLHIWTDFTGAVKILFDKNLVLNNIVDKFVNDYRAAIGQPPVDIRRPDRIDEDPGDGGDGGDDDDDDGGDGGDEVQPPPPEEGQPPPPPPEDDPTDPESSDPSFDARTIEEEERQDIEGVDTALPPAEEMPLVIDSRRLRLLSNKFKLPLREVQQYVDKLRADAGEDPVSARSEVIGQQLKDLAKLEAESQMSSSSSSSSSSSGSNVSKIDKRLSQIEKKIDKNMKRQDFIGKVQEDKKDKDIGSPLRTELDFLDEEMTKLFAEKGELIKQKERLVGLPEALPPPSPLPAPVSGVTRFPLRTDTIPQTAVSDSGSPRPLVRGDEEEDVDYADVWPDLVEETPTDDVWPTIAGLAEEALTMDDIRDMPFWPDIADQEGFTQRFLTNRQNRRLGKMTGRATGAYAAAWKFLAGSRTPRTFAQFLGKEKNKQKLKFLVDKEKPVGQRTIVRI